MIASQAINAFNAERPAHARGVLCHAPFKSINFEQNGSMRVCCYNKTEILGSYPQQSIHEAWFGEKAETLRGYMRGNSLAGGCMACAEQISAGNYMGTKAIYYDEYADNKNFWGRLKSGFRKTGFEDYPKVFEFEISNICNLECVMCDGYFSSAIRKNRERLPKLKNPYDDNFVEQVKHFLPHLTDAKFLGGEPFLIDTYYKIWDEIINRNLPVRVHITTNGTTLTKKAKSYLEKMAAGITMSIDSLHKENYERIRKNANFDEVQEAIRWYLDYRDRKNEYLVFSVCPMKSNAWELPNIVDFCNRHGIYVHLNTVWFPEKESIRFMAAEKITEIMESFGGVVFDPNNPLHRHNEKKIRDFRSHLQAWVAESEARMEEQAKIDFLKNIFETFGDAEIDAMPLPAQDMMLLYKHNYREHYASFSPTGDADERHEELKHEFAALLAENGELAFLQNYITCLNTCAQKLMDPRAWDEFKVKTENILSVAVEHGRVKKVSEQSVQNVDIVANCLFIQKTPLQTLRNAIREI